MPKENGPQAPANLAAQLERVAEMINSGQYQTAEVICRELVDSYPDSAEAHAVLADAFAARQLWSEAADWYELAVQLGAGPEVDQRLERVRRRRAAYSGEAPSESNSAQLERQRARLGWILGGAAAAVLLAVGIVVLGLQTPRMPATPSSGLAARTYPPRAISGRSATAQVRTAPQSVPRRPQQPKAPTSATSSPSAQHAPIPHAPAIITRGKMGPVSDRDYRLARVLGSLTWPDSTPMSDAVAVMMDPYTGYAMITFEIPRALEGQELFDMVMRQSYSVAAAALRTDAGIQSLTIRVVATMTTPDKEKRSVVAFRANTNRVALEEWMKLGREPTVQELWDEVFATSWWNPNVPRDRLE